MKHNYVEELVNATRNQLKAEERLMRSERIKIGLRIRKERLEREKEEQAQVKALH